MYGEGIKPVYKIMDKWGQWLINPSRAINQYQYLMEHSIETEDYYIEIDTASYEGNFYTLGKKIETETHPGASDGDLFSFYLYL